MTVYDNIRNNSIKTIILIVVYPLVQWVLFFFAIKYTAILYSIASVKIFSVKFTLLNLNFYSLIIATVLVIITTTISIHSFKKGVNQVAFNFIVLNNIYSYDEITNIAHNLSIIAGIECPDVLVFPSDAMNAYAMGINADESTIVVTTGLINNLSTSEVEAVLAHEIAHIANRDTRLMMAILANVGTVIAMYQTLFKSTELNGHTREYDAIEQMNSLVLMSRILFLPSIALKFILYIYLKTISPLFNLSISRKREFVADATAVLYTRNPNALIEALLIISSDNNVKEFNSSLVSSLCIVTPSDKSNKLRSLFRTHPPLYQRIEAISTGSYIVHK